MGPSRLNAVRTFEVSCARAPQPSCWGGTAARTSKPMPHCLTHSATPSGPRSTATPSASSTSALPQSEDRNVAVLRHARAARARRGCTSRWRCSPCPHRRRPCRRCPARRRPRPRRRCAPSWRAPRPAISAPVSPLARSSTKNAAICSGSASSSASIRACASASDRSSASQRRSMTWRRSTPAARDTAREGAARRSDAGARPRAANRAEPGARVDAARTDEARGVAARAERRAPSPMRWRTWRP